MKENKEITALLHLIDDPDTDVFDTVSSKIVTFGKEIIPNLESLWESTRDLELQERIELIIHRVHLRDLSHDFDDWKEGEADLLAGAMLVARYHFPDLQPAQVLHEIEKLRRNIWLELNSYLTPLEKINVFNSIFFNYYKLEGTEISYDNPEYFLISKTLESKKGNSISNGIIYLSLCKLLDIPVRAVHIPKQFIMAYFDENPGIPQTSGHPSEKILFFIDPLNGQMYSHADVEKYLKRLELSPIPSYFRPQGNKQIIIFLLEQLAKCFDNDRNRYKMEELEAIARSLREE